METRLNSVTLWFSLSAKGRKDAFAKGVAVGVDYDDFFNEPLEDQQTFVCAISVDASSPELFSRAARLACNLSEDGATAELPVGCGYWTVNDFWDGEDWTMGVDPTEQNPFLIPGRDHLTSLLEVPGEPTWEPDPQFDVLRALDDEPYTSIKELALNRAVVYLRFFSSFDHYPSVVELVERAEIERADALEAASLDEGDYSYEALCFQHESWVDAHLDWFVQAVKTHLRAAGIEHPPPAVQAILDEAEQLSSRDTEQQVYKVLVNGPQRVLAALAESARLADDLAVHRWCLAHGSRRLRRIAEEGLLPSSMAVYRDERLAADRPGWVWQPSTVTLRDPVAPTDDAFDMLDAARESDPGAVLRFATLGKGGGVFVATSTFLGRQIWFPADALASIEAVS